VTASLNDGCPSADVLGRYIDGVLDKDEVARVTHHVTHCARCRASIENVVEIHQEPRRARPLPQPLWWIAAATVVIAVGLPALRQRQNANADQAFRRLVDASPKSERVVEARLTGGFPWAPFRGPRRSARPKSTEELILSGAAGEVLQQLGNDHSARALHAAGVAQLMAGDVHAAVRILEAAARRAPKDARVASDLSAALYTAAEGNPTMLHRALATATDACTREPMLEEARFNRAVLLESAGSSAEATAAWHEYLARFPSGAWAAEARARLARGARR